MVKGLGVRDRLGVRGLRIQVDPLKLEYKFKVLRDLLGRFSSSGLPAQNLRGFCWVESL